MVNIIPIILAYFVVFIPYLLFSDIEGYILVFIYAILSAIKSQPYRHITILLYRRIVILYCSQPTVC